MKVAVLCCLAIVASLVSAYTPTKYITHNGVQVYVKGINVPWFAGQYGHDLGHNQITNYGIWWNQNQVSSWFADVASLGFNVMRVWIFENSEGLLFNSNNQITGIDPTFLTNLDTMVSLANQHGLMIYMMMIDTGITAQNPIITNAAAQTAYLNNALGPIIQRYKGNNAIFAIDIFNEIESQIAGSTGNWGTTGCTWTQARSFMQACRNTIKNIDSTRLVSCSSGWHDHSNVQSGEFSGLGFDFYDFHSYTNTGSVPSASSVRSDLPIIVGEYGAVFTNNLRNDTLETNANTAYAKNIINNGYAGGNVWCYGEDSNTDAFSFLNADGSHRAVAASMQTFNKAVST